jgi:acyl-CoA reductase-like NAD-dependent aldehyde dehydrogenase
VIVLIGTLHGVCACVRETGAERARLLFKLSELLDQRKEEIAAVESLDNGKPYATHSLNIDLPLAVNTYRYYAGWADKIQGRTIPVSGPFHAYSLLQPVGVVGSIIPWNVRVPCSASWSSHSHSRPVQWAHDVGGRWRACSSRW